MARRDPRTFGRARGYVSPRVRKARRNARIAAGVALMLGLGLSVASYALMGMASGEYGQRYGDLTGLAMLSGIAAFACFAVSTVAATEA